MRSIWLLALGWLTIGCLTIGCLTMGCLTIGLEVLFSGFEEAVDFEITVGLGIFVGIGNYQLRYCLVFESFGGFVGFVYLVNSKKANFESFGCSGVFATGVECLLIVEACCLNLCRYLVQCFGSSFGPSFEPSFGPSFEPSFELSFGLNFEPNSCLNFELKHDLSYEQSFAPNFEPNSASNSE